MAARGHHGPDDAGAAHHAHIGLDAVRGALVDRVVDLARTRHSIDDARHDDGPRAHRKAVGDVQMRQCAVGLSVLHLAGEQGVAMAQLGVLQEQPLVGGP